jgi:hypothetical protein
MVTSVEDGWRESSRTPRRAPAQRGLAEDRASVRVPHRLDLGARRQRRVQDAGPPAVLAVLAHRYSCQLPVGGFTTLGLFPQRIGARVLADSAVYLKYQNILAEKLERLMEIAQRLDGSRP